MGIEEIERRFDATQRTPLDGGIPLTLALALLLFSIGFMFLLIARPRLPRFYYPRIWSQGDRPPVTLSFANVSWIPRALRTPKDDVAMRGGMYGLLYLRFQLFMFVYFLFMAVLALAIILPINLTGGQSGLNGFVNTTVTNVKQGSPVLYAHCVIAVIFVLVGLAIISWYQLTYFTSRKGFRSRDFVNSHTIMIRGISKKVNSGAELFSFMDGLYPGQVVSAHIGYDAHELLKLKNKKESRIRSLARDEHVFHNDGERRMRNPGTCGWCATCLHLRAKEDSMSYNKATIAKVSGQIKRRQQTQQKTTGVAFVTFETAQVTHRCLRDFYLRAERKQLLEGAPDQELLSHVKASRWSVTRAAKPSELFVNNFKVGPKQKMLRRTIITVTVVIVALIWSFPISFLASISTLSSIPGLSWVEDLNPAVQDLIEGYVPTLLTSAFVACLPFIMGWVALLEGPYTLPERDASAMRHYFTFVVLNVLIFPSFLIGTFDSIALIFSEGFDGVNSLLGDINYALQGAFFVNYVIQQTFFSGIIRLLRLHNLAARWYKEYNAVTDDEYEEIRKFVSVFEYRTRFSQTLIVTAVVLTYVIEVPLIIVAGVVYLIVIHIIDRNNILHVYPKNVDGDSSMIPTVITMFVIGLLIMQSFLAIMFWFQRSIGSFAIIIVSLAFTLFMMFLLNFLNWYNKYKYIKYGEPLLIEWDLPRSVLEKAYMHPGLEDEEADLNERIDHFIEHGGDYKKEFSTNKTAMAQLEKNYNEAERAEGGGESGNVASAIHDVNDDDDLYEKQV
mmetsp:Transcript_4563/g.16052  ORF Transcript_4563/g.16052 Transcript_4563/m.16052 type:complete len:786 (-) Transcript_4563:35-2392(-)|eukprot:CAMPEP_0114622084 /NCGR_PEP_ID=MMETSP0168-20121206/9558_1 /TAXON_ID=95228 ORGANISM="Vannella sp., Strain DIVA3 517/6/12" /NCGR_SAMPLE_ID=MMETSP0168 /ASSEMBLY_ACC=CAM_ASM_000044 /LENGTH=785 /DNA_ID=CAMNT_0001833295 /DNA_START=157 /DNA_END=2514 /DNA_ORIENTATION=+